MAATRTTRKAPAEKLAEAPPAKERPTALTPEVLADLRRPFTAAAVKFKPQAVAKSGDKALATFYIDARLVAERLNHVVGPENWTPEFHPIVAETNAQAWQAFQFPVECRLTVFGVTKMDVGVYMQGAKADDKAVKSAYSDALKRAAVMFGIGAYLYALPKQWFPFKQGPNGKGGSFVNEAQIRKAYESMVAPFGVPIDHGDLDDHETADAQEPVDAARPEPPTVTADAEGRTTTKPPRDPKIHVTDKSEIEAMVALSKEAGFTPAQIKKVLDNEQKETGGHYRKTWLVEQLQFLNDEIAAIAAKKAAA